MRSMITLVALLLTVPAHAEVVFDWVEVGDSGNSCETQSQGCFGSVVESYEISMFETTNTQYAEFLNAVAATDTYALYHADNDGITRSSGPGGFIYSVETGFEDKPVQYVSFWDAIRFANWLHNGQPTGDQDDSTTEDGAYTITAAGIAANSIARNLDATAFVPSEDEWYKAAYYDGVSDYYNYPTGTETQTSCAAPGATANTANCGYAVGAPTDFESYPASASYYGTFDQGGNVWEWNETSDGSNRVLRGGSFLNSASSLAASSETVISPAFGSDLVGFRVARAAVPEPGEFTLLAAGLGGLGILHRRRMRASEHRAWESAR
jgi:formylglycine-generating enzyme required for sulfatase activity